MRYYYEFLAKWFLDLVICRNILVVIVTTGLPCLGKSHAFVDVSDHVD